MSSPFVRRGVWLLDVIVGAAPDRGLILNIPQNIS